MTNTYPNLPSFTLNFGPLFTGATCLFAIIPLPIASAGRPFLLLRPERKLERELREGAKVAIVGAQRRTMLDREGGEVDVRRARAGRTGVDQRMEEDRPMPCAGFKNRDVVALKPCADDFGGLLGSECGVR